MELLEQEELENELINLIREQNILIEKMENEERGKRLFLKSGNSNTEECVVRFLNLDETRNVKILKSDFNNQIEPNRWIILGLISDHKPLNFYMIPITVFDNPTNWFIVNDQPPRLSHLSNWEIKIYLQAIPYLEPHLLISTLAGIKFK